MKYSEFAKHNEARKLEDNIYAEQSEAENFLEK